MADGPEQLTRDGLNETDRRSVEVVFVERRTGDGHQLAGLNLVGQTDGEHADAGRLELARCGGSRFPVLRLSVRDDDADVVHVRTVAVVR